MVGLLDSNRKIGDACAEPDDLRRPARVRLIGAAAREPDQPAVRPAGGQEDRRRRRVCHVVEEVAALADHVP
jgi:hypothetical protein